MKWSGPVKVPLVNMVQYFNSIVYGTCYRIINMNFVGIVMLRIPDNP